MEITLSPELEKRVREIIERGEYENADSLVREALDWFLSSPAFH
jgi:Arc/MetJ-type ribon-helix-helix transcriptional regulator